MGLHFELGCGLVAHPGRALSSLNDHVTLIRYSQKNALATRVVHPRLDRRGVSHRYSKPTTFFIVHLDELKHLLFNHVLSSTPFGVHSLARFSRLYVVRMYESQQIRGLAVSFILVFIFHAHPGYPGFSISNVALFCLLSPLNISGLDHCSIYIPYTFSCCYYK
jgi:hypothetical protein